MPQPDPVVPVRSRRAFFVYYTVATTHADRLKAAFAEAASAATAALPWQAELMRRAEPPVPAEVSRAADADLQTWMEIYWVADGHLPGDRWAAPLRQLIEERARAAGLLDLVHGERHYEAFESCA